MASPQPPTGEVTFLFTDIEGSTRLVERLGTAAWSPLLARHRAIVRAQLEAHRGTEAATEGDSFFVVFPDPVEAVAATAAMQRGLAAEPWPEGVQIRVRMGLHTGWGELDADGSYVGHDVHRAARVAGAAHGGQVLLSEATAAAVESRLPAGTGVRPLGAHRLKDLRPERIVQLVVEGLAADFPPIRSLDARPNNLPTQLTSFVGRERELDQAAALLDATRLLTLTGPGGTGKSRLSLQLAAAVADRFPDGTWFVPLAAVTSPELVVPAIAREIGIGERPDVSPLEVLASELEGKQALLVLDNLEQLRDAVPDIAELLRRLPRLRIVATSQSPLRISGEQEFPVPGLPSPVDLDRLGPYERERLPESLRRHDPASLLAFEAVRLFVARAQAVRPGFALGDANAGDVAAIVAHLDGVPLAIELAAARLRFLTPAAIHERLEGRLDLPGAGAADVPERQRSLRGAIEWSHDLLDEPSRGLFRRLSVFVGGFDLRSAEAVAGTAAELGVDPLEGLAALVDHSLVRSDDVDGEPRYSLLAPIRDYAAERLEASGDAAEARERHAHAYARLARELEPALAGPDQRSVLDRLEREHANLRAAIDWADEHGDAELAVGIVAAIWRMWQKRGYLREARTRVGVLLGRPWLADAPVQVRARAHEVMGGIVYWHGDFLAARPHYEAALEAWRGIGDRAEVANALYNLSFCYSIGALGDAEGRRMALLLLGEALELYRATGNDRGTADVLWGIGIQHYFSSENEPAAARFEEALEMYRRVGDRTQEAWALHQLGSARLKLGETERARSDLSEALALFDASGDVAGVTLGLDDMSAVALREGDLPRAARLAGLARRIQTSSGTLLAGAVLDAFEAATRANGIEALAPDALERHQAEGAALSLPQGVRYALGRATWEEARAEGTAEGMVGHEPEAQGSRDGGADGAGRTPGAAAGAPA